MFATSSGVATRCRMDELRCSFTNAFAAASALAWSPPGATICCTPSDRVVSKATLTASLAMATEGPDKVPIFSAAFFSE